MFVTDSYGHSKILETFVSNILLIFSIFLILSAFLLIQVYEFEILEKSVILGFNVYIAN